ncbi:aminopeptidase P N-terminal domain-containing protein [Saezia sanguinis]|uniref:aminopeptidase P N-terminal domain-containing protein n=1 Tax=Saezia sanguinis TaxID=1965230 RepID=UPI003059DDAC
MTTTTPSHTVYQQRRTRVAQWLKAHGGGIAVLPTAPEVSRNRDNDYSYRPDSYFYYLTGFTEPGAWLIIDDTGHSTLFCRAKNPDQEVWTGYRLGPDAAPEALAVDTAYPVEELDQQIPQLLANQPAVWFPFATHTGLEAQITNWLKDVRALVRTGVSCPQAQYDLCAVLDEMRLIKDAHEIELMRRAGEISALGHMRAMQKCAQMMRAGEDVREYHLEAELLHEFCRHGAQDVAFNSIVAGGANACILHYRAGKAAIHSGDLVLIDAGGEYGCYAGDISRTFPANGRFSGPQRTLYDLVQAAQEAAIAATAPGATFNDPHDAALRILSQGMLDLGLLKKDTYGSVDDVIEQRAYFRFYMHRTSHWLGMDVHDCGSYVEPETEPVAHHDAKTGKTTYIRPSRILRPGMALTMEPGIYVQAADDIPAEFHNIGIRIEDDALVTENGCELLTRKAPVKADEIEVLMR